MGLPVVGTTSSTQGVGGGADRDYVVADSADAQVEAIGRVFEHPEEGRALGERVRRFVVEHYAWESCMNELDHIIERASAGRGTRGGREDAC